MRQTLTEALNIYCEMERYHLFMKDSTYYRRCHLVLLWSGACVFTVEVTQGGTYYGRFVAAVACDDALTGIRCPSYGRPETF